MVNRYDIERRISAYQFALYDLGLFLDSHPCDKEAMELRCVYQKKLQKLIDEYEQCYGKYILTQQDVQESWKEWVCDPWPWDLCKGDGRYVAI